MDKPLRGLQAYYLDTNNIRRPLVVLSWDEWLRLAQVDGSTGAINSYFVDKQASQLVVNFWLTPDATAATGTCHILLETQAKNPINLTETLAFPVEWRMFLHWALAAELATGQPQAIVDRCDQRTATYRAALQDWDVEDAPTRLEPDQRVFQATGQFK